jgi:23S rRNA (adenine2030-N6)-methyltransferase
MLVINPPYTLAEEMRQALSEIAPLLGAQVQWTVQQLVEE